ncbi:MAG TPA: orotate phosphoribosyltransferase [Elusimicrobiales bacterium]|nr:orotate phosphoribosyltransferase [Elusimicrobiales bacterium]
MTEAEIKVYLADSGALLSGHFLLSSGLHSPDYVQCAQALKNPHWAGELGAALAALWLGAEPEIVVAPAMGGLIIGHEVARALGVDFIFTERENNEMALRRGFTLKPGARVLIVEDVFTTGKSTLETAALVRAGGAEVIGALSVIDRMGGRDLKFPHESLVKMDLTTYAAADCPLCRAGLPPVKPGSRKLS